MIFAAADQWVKLAVFLVVAFIYVIRFVSERIREKQAKAQLARPVMRPMNPADPIDNEIAEFLKKASTKRDNPRRANERGTASLPPPAAPRDQNRNRGQRRKSGEESRENRRKRSASPSGPVETPTPAEIISDSSRGRLGDLDTRKFAERAAHLTKLDHAEDSIEKHLKQVFSHPVGHLSTSLREEQAAALTPTQMATAAKTLRDASGIAQMLTHANLKTAVVLNEVLQRPEHRW